MCVREKETEREKREVRGERCNIYNYIQQRKLCENAVREPLMLG